MKSDRKFRKWMFLLMAVAVSLHFYVVQELVVLFGLFAIGFCALAFVVVSLGLLLKGWELAMLRTFDSEGRVARLWLALAGWATVDTVKVTAGVEKGKQELGSLTAHTAFELGAQKSARNNLEVHAATWTS